MSETPVESTSSSYILKVKNQSLALFPFWKETSLAKFPRFCDHFCDQLLMVSIKNLVLQSEGQKGIFHSKITRQIYGENNENLVGAQAEPDLSSDQM